MAMDYKQLRLIEIYKKLYQYRDMLRGGPSLTLDVSAMDEDKQAESFRKMNSELTLTISYLLGLKEDQMSVQTMLDSLLKHYKNDDFWRRVILDYIEVQQEKDEEDIAIEKREVKKKGKSLQEKIRAFQKQRKELIKRFSAEIENEKFPVNAQRLFKNYLHMADLDAEKAWDTLIVNPAFFSPIVVEDKEGNRILSVDDAKKVNKKMGSFIKKMKA